MRFEEFESVEAEVRVGNLEALAQDRAGFILYQKETAVRFVASDLLHDV